MANGAMNVRVEGRVNGPWVETLRQSCEPWLAEGRRVALDLSAVSYVSAPGIGVIQDLASRGAEVVDCSAFVAEQLHGGGAMVAADTLDGLLAPTGAQGPDHPVRPPQDAQPTSGGREALRAARRGDRSSLETLAWEHGARMLAVAWQLLRRSDEARETVQEAWLDALRAGEAEPPGVPLGAWLEELTTHAVFMRFRAASRGPDQDLSALLPRFDGRGHWAETPPVVARDDEPDGAPEARLCDAVERLPLQHRAVIMLRDFLGVSQAEAAEVLGVPPSTVARRRHAGTQALAALMHAQLAP